MSTENRAEEMEARETHEAEEISLKFAKSLVGEPFVSKKGIELVEVKIPNSDPSDKRPWASFVAAAGAIHDNRFGKGVWMKVASDGHTTIKRPVITQDAEGNRRYENHMETIPNRELKKMVEFYRNRERTGENNPSGGPSEEKKTDDKPEVHRQKKKSR